MTTTTSWSETSRGRPSRSTSSTSRGNSTSETGSSGRLRLGGPAPEPGRAEPDDRPGPAPGAVQMDAVAVLARRSGDVIRPHGAPESARDLRLRPASAVPAGLDATPGRARGPTHPRAAGEAVLARR